MSKKQPNQVVGFVAAGSPAMTSVLCIGVDVTWFGGSNKVRDHDSRTELVASATKVNGQWALPQIERIRLTDFNSKAGDSTPNSDPAGTMITSAIRSVIQDHDDIERVVVSLDAPLRAIPRRQHYTPRRKRPRTGEVGRRDCDKRWAQRVTASPEGWRDAKIQPGAPLPSRITSIVDLLQADRFVLYEKPGLPLSNRVLIECFPNEVIWSAGVLGQCGGGSYASMTAYKRMGRNNVVLPLSILGQVFQHTIEPCLAVAGKDKASWSDHLWEWINNDKIIVRNGEGRTGKGFDDAIDSMLALLAATALADGIAHVHLGEREHDGHILGPGLGPQPSAPLRV